VLDPGLVKTEIGEHFEGPAVLRLLMNHVIPFFVAAGMERGSEQYVRLAADPALASASGRYFVQGEEENERSSPLTRDPAVREQIVDVAEAWAAPFLRPLAGAAC